MAFLCREKFYRRRRWRRRPKDGRERWRLHRRAWRWPRSCRRRSIVDLRRTSILRENFLQRCDAFFVLLHCPDGDADPFRQTVAAKWTDDDFHSEEFFENRRTVAH